jgi:hypothetical protein
LVYQAFGAIDGDIEESAEAMALVSQRNYMVVLEIHKLHLRRKGKLSTPPLIHLRARMN